MEKLLEEKRELVQKRNEKQSELNQAIRLKEASIITGEEEDVELASRKMEKLILDIEKIDRRVKSIEEERKVRIEEAKNRMAEIDSQKEEVRAQIRFLKNEYVAAGEKDVLDALELKVATLKEYDDEIAKLDKFVSDSDKVIDDDTDEILEEDDNSIVEDFITDEIESGKDFEEIANNLNKKTPSTLDEYVASDEYKILRELYRSFCWTDSKGNIENPGNVRSISLSNGFNVDLEKLGKIDFNICENIKQLKDMLVEDREIVKEDIEIQEHYRLNDQFKILEEKTIDMIIPHIKNAYNMHIGERVLNNRGTDFTEWLVGGIFPLRSNVLDLMFNNFNAKAKKDFLPKDQLREVGDLGFIGADDVKKYAEKMGIIAFKEEKKSELTSMFENDPRDIDEDKDQFVR